MIMINVNNWSQWIWIWGGGGGGGDWIGFNDGYGMAKKNEWFMNIMNISFSAINGWQCVDFSFSSINVDSLLNELPLLLFSQNVGSNQYCNLGPHVQTNNAMLLTILSQPPQWWISWWGYNIHYDHEPLSQWLNN